MTTVRDALRIRDTRLTPAAVVILVFLMIDFFGRVALFSEGSSRLDIEDVVTLSDDTPQIAQPLLDAYLSKIDNLRALPMQDDSALPIKDLAAQPLAAEPADGYWRAGELSYKLVALVESAERFAVLYSLNNKSGEQEMVELRLGDSVVGYTVSELRAKELQLTSDNGDQITLMLFEPERLQD